MIRDLEKVIMAGHKSDVYRTLFSGKRFWIDSIIIIIVLNLMHPATELEITIKRSVRTSDIRTISMKSNFQSL